MATILSRIQEIASMEGITIGALERQIGASKGVLSRAINNGTDIQSKWIQIIVENYPQYSAEWLLTGRGELLKSSIGVPIPIPDEALASHGITPEILHELLNRLTEQAAEIGRLNERIAQLQREKGKNASDAPTSDIANVG